MDKTKVNIAFTEIDNTTTTYRCTHFTYIYI